MKNQQMCKAISKAADSTPFNGQVDDNNNNNNSRSSASSDHMCIDLNISTPCFTSDDSNISIPTTLGSSSLSSQNLQMNCDHKPGLGMILSSNEAPRLWRTKSSLFRNDARLDQHVPNAANNISKPIIVSVHYLVQLPVLESHGVYPNLHVLDTIYGPRQDPFTQRIVRVVWPCILATQNIKLALVTGGFGYVPPSSIPVAICTKHGNVGFLKLEEIENSEGYTLIIHHHPDPRVVHMYNQCVLTFSPTAPIYFHEKNDHHQLSPHFKMDDSYIGAKNPYVHNKFLKNCQTCDKSLEGRDIYIYRGDSSFCSEECREVEIEADKQKNLMKLEAAKSYTKSGAATAKKSIFFISGDEHVGA